MMNRTICMKDCGTLVSIPRTNGEDREYIVELPKEDYIVVQVGAIYGTNAAKFEHPNILAKIDETLEFKHYRNSGSKFWTSHAGTNFLFAIPKSRIHLALIEGFSYVPIIIGDTRFVLNVSGNTGGNDFGWKDWVRQCSHLLVEKTKKRMQILADNAMSPEEAATAGANTFVSMCFGREQNINMFTELVAMKDVKLAIGMKVVLNDNCTLKASTGSFVVESKYPRMKKVIVTDSYGGRWRIGRNQINWTKTAIENGIQLRQPVAESYILPVFP